MLGHDSVTRYVYGDGGSSLARYGILKIAVEKGITSTSNGILNSRL